MPDTVANRNRAVHCFRKLVFIQPQFECKRLHCGLKPPGRWQVSTRQIDRIIPEKTPEKLRSSPIKIHSGRPIGRPMTPCIAAARIAHVALVTTRLHARAAAHM
jgi:hypothetical protein